MGTTRTIFLSTIFLLFLSCRNNVEHKESTFRVYGEDLIIYDIDSCEYIGNPTLNFFTHKGNCKYCLKRQKYVSPQKVDSL